MGGCCVEADVSELGGEVSLFDKSIEERLACICYQEYGDGNHQQGQPSQVHSDHSTSENTAHHVPYAYNSEEASCVSVESSPSVTLPPHGATTGPGNERSRSVAPASSSISLPPAATQLARAPAPPVLSQGPASSAYAASNKAAASTFVRAAPSAPAASVARAASLEGAGPLPAASVARAASLEGAAPLSSSEPEALAVEGAGIELPQGHSARSRQDELYPMPTVLSARSTGSDGFPPTPEEELRRRSQLQVVVKAFVQRALRGIMCHVLDVQANMLRPAMYSVDKSLQRLLVQVDGIMYWSAGLVELAQVCVGVHSRPGGIDPSLLHVSSLSTLGSNAQESLILLEHQDSKRLFLLEQSARRAEDFRIAICILSMYGRDQRTPASPQSSCRDETGGQNDGREVPSDGRPSSGNGWILSGRARQARLPFDPPPGEFGGEPSLMPAGGVVARAAAAAATNQAATRVGLANSSPPDRETAEISKPQSWAGRLPGNSQESNSVGNCPLGDELPAPDPQLARVAETALAASPDHAEHSRSSEALKEELARQLEREEHFRHVVV